MAAKRRAFGLFDSVDRLSNAFVGHRHRVAVGMDQAFAVNGQCDMALQHAGEAVLHLRAGGAHDQRARHICGAIAILAARIDQIDAVVGYRQIGLVRNAIMRQRGVGAGGGDGVERQIFEAVGFGAELAQAFSSTQLIDSAITTSLMLRN